MFSVAGLVCGEKTERFSECVVINQSMIRILTAQLHGTLSAISLPSPSPSTWSRQIRDHCTVTTYATHLVSKIRVQNRRSDLETIPLPTRR